MNLNMLTAAMLPFHAEAPAPASVSDPNAAPPAPPPAAAPAPDAPPAAPAAGAPSEPSLLSQGKAEADKDKPIGAKPDDHSWIPGKYRVMAGEKGKETLDVEASSKKVAEAHTALEKRAGELGLPPEKAADYKITLPEGSTLNMEMLQGPQLDAFKESAHKGGMTQKQFDVAVGAHLQGLNDFVAGLAEQGAAMAKDELAKDPDWQGQNLSPQLKLAYRTFQAFATTEEAAEIDRIGNNPVFLKVLARIGKDLGEDRLGRGTGTAAALGQDALDNLMRAGGPYWDAQHAEHKKYVDAVTRHFEATRGTKQIPASMNS